MLVRTKVWASMVQVMYMLIRTNVFDGQGQGIYWPELKYVLVRIKVSADKG